MCSAPNVYMFVYTLIGAHHTLIGAQIVPLNKKYFTHCCKYHVKSNMHNQIKP